MIQELFGQTLRTKKPTAGAMPLAFWNCASSYFVGIAEEGCLVAVRIKESSVGGHHLLCDFASSVVMRLTYQEAFAKP
jgi:hypothetical protein